MDSSKISSILILLVSVLISSCDEIDVPYHFGGKVYDASSTSAEGEKFITENNVRYVAKTFGVFYADIWRGKGVFAIDVKSNGSEISYRPLSAELAAYYKLTPKFTWWDTNGRWVILLLVLVFALVYFGPKAWRDYRNKKIVRLNKACFTFLAHVAWADREMKPEELALIRFAVSKGDFGVASDFESIAKLKDEPIPWEMLKRFGKEQKLDLYKLGLCCAISDGDLSPAEISLLTEYGKLMKLTSAEVQQIHDEIKIEMQNVFQQKQKTGR